MAKNPFDKFDNNTGNPFDSFGGDTLIKNPAPDSVIMGTEAPTPEWAGKHPNLYGLYGAAKELYRTVGKPAIETVGMVGGGALGVPAGLPGIVAGSGLGYAGARGATEGLDKLFELDRGQQNPTLGQRVKSTATDLALGAVGASPAPKSQIKNIMPQVDETIFKNFGGRLSPSEVTGGKTAAQVESLLEQVPFASDVMQNWREVNQLKPLIAIRNKYLETGLENTPRGEVLGQQIKSAIDKRLGQFEIAKTGEVNKLRDAMLSKLGSKESYETLSKEAQGIINTKSAEAVASKNKLYQAVNDVIPQGELPFSNYQAEAQKQLDELSKLPNADKEFSNILKWGTKIEQSPEELAILEEISKYPMNIQQAMRDKTGVTKITEVTKDWKTMQSHRNQLNDLIRANDESLKNNAPNLKGQLTDVGRRAKLLRKALDDDFEQIAQNKGGEVLDRWNTAQAFYSNEYTPIWKQKTIKSMAYKNPSELVDIAIKQGSTTEVELAKKALGEDGFNRTIKPAFTNKLLGQGREEAFNPAKLQKALNNYGDETLLKIYSKGELESLREISRTGQILLDKELPNVSILKTIASNPNNVIMDSILGSVERLPNSKSVLKNITALEPFLTAPQKEGIKLELLDKVFRQNITTGQVEAGTMGKNIYNYRRALEKFFTLEEMKGLDSISLIGRAMSKAQQMAANPSGTAKNVIAFGASNELIFKPLETAMQGKILDAAGQVIVAGVSKVLGARKLAELYLNPTTRKLLTKGMVTPRFTKEGIDITKKLSIVLGNDYMDTQGEQQ